MCRYLNNNSITLIASGAFTGLGNLRGLYLQYAITSLNRYLHVIVQGPVHQRDHINRKWRVYWTRKRDSIVWREQFSLTGVLLIIILVQALGPQPDYIHCKWCIYWAWKPDFFVWQYTSVASFCDVAHGYRSDICQTIESHRFQVVLLLDMET
jgi:hypothetical protein